MKLHLKKIGNMIYIMVSRFVCKINLSKIMSGPVGTLRNLDYWDPSKPQDSKSKPTQGV